MEYGVFIMSLKKIIFDADGTLLHGKNPFMSLATKLDCDEEMWPRVHAYLDGKLDYRELVAWQTEVYKKAYIKKYGEKPRAGDFERLMEVPNVMSDAKEVVESLKNKGVQFFVLSSGLRYLIRELSKAFIADDHVYANRFLYDVNGEFVTIQVTVTGDKLEALQQILTEHELDITETAYVGDNEFDVPIINYMIPKGGHIFFLEDSQSQHKELDLPTNERFIRIPALKNILEHIAPSLSSDNQVRNLGVNLSQKKVIMMCGIPGVGKSTLSRKLANKLAFKYLSTDDIRLKDVAVGEKKYGTGAGHDEYITIRRKTYKRLYEIAKAELQHDSRVILDGTFMDELRDEMMEKLLKIISPEEIALVVVKSDEATLKSRFPEDTLKGQHYLRLYEQWKKDIMLGKYWYPREGEYEGVEIVEVE